MRVLGSHTLASLLAIAIQADQVRGPGHTCHHLAIAFAAVAPNDRAQRRVGFHRRGIDADSLALDQAMRGQTSEYPGEDLVVDLERQAATAAAS
jgi:hypothetical protein